MLNEALNLVHFTKKPKKADAKRLLEFAVDGKDLSPAEWAGLLRYFHPTPAIPKTLRQWLAAATTDDPVRPYLSAVHRLSPTVYVATDNKRIHVATPPVDLPDVDTLSPTTWQPITDPDYVMRPAMLDQIQARISKRDTPVPLPPVQDWPTTSDPDARYIPDTEIAIYIPFAKQGLLTHYLGTSTKPLGQSAMFRTPYGYAIIAPYRA